MKLNKLIRVSKQHAEAMYHIVLERENRWQEKLAKKFNTLMENYHCDVKRNQDMEKFAKKIARKERRNE